MRTSNSSNACGEQLELPTWDLQRDRRGITFETQLLITEVQRQLIYGMSVHFLCPIIIRTQFKENIHASIF